MRKRGLESLRVFTASIMGLLARRSRAHPRWVTFALNCINAPRREHKLQEFPRKIPRDPRPKPPSPTFFSSVLRLPKDKTPLTTTISHLTSVGEAAELAGSGMVRKDARGICRNGGERSLRSSCHGRLEQVIICSILL